MKKFYKDYSDYPAKIKEDKIINGGDLVLELNFNYYERELEDEPGYIFGYTQKRGEGRQFYFARY